MKIKRILNKFKYDTFFIELRFLFHSDINYEVHSRLEEVVWSNLPKNIKCMLRDQMEKD